MRIRSNRAWSSRRCGEASLSVGVLPKSFIPQFYHFSCSGTDLQPVCFRQAAGPADSSRGLLNMLEMAFRAYDPCFGCATHSLPGQMPLEIAVRDPRGELIQRLSQYMD